MNPVPYTVTAGTGTGGCCCCCYNGPGGAAFGVYVKMSDYTANGTVLWDLWAASNGYTRCSVGNNGVLKAENVLTDVNLPSWNMTVTSSGFVLPLNQWTWVWYRQYPSSCCCGCNGCLAFFQLGWSTSSTASSVTNNVGNFNFNGFYYAQLGVGAPVTPTTSYDPFPNQAGYELSKFRYQDHGNPAFSAPTVDPPAGTYGILYNARQPASATFLQDTGGQWNLQPGTQGLTITQDGPYP